MTPQHQNTCEHEGRHAAVSALFDFRMKSVVALPEARADGISGQVHHDHDGEHWDQLRTAEMLVTVLSGGIGEPGWPPRWPLNPNGPSDDERHAHKLAKQLNLTERQYNALCGIAHRAVNHPAVKSAAGAIAALLEHGPLTGRQARDAAATMFDAHDRELADWHTKATEPDGVTQIRYETRQMVTKAIQHGVDVMTRRKATAIAREFGIA